MLKALLLAWLFLHRTATAAPVQIGSKSFTESVILGELLTELSRSQGTAAVHRQDLGGSQILWKALQRGELDAYVEYTGTLWRELLGKTGPVSLDAIREAIRPDGLRVSRPLGFDNGYAIGVRRKTAEALGLSRLSDLARHPELRFGLDHEFLDRAEGWPTLQPAYGLAPQSLQGLDHDVAYRALADGAVDVTDVWGTDAEIAYYDLVALEDDRRLFPTYHGVVVYRADLAERAPALARAIAKLEGAIPQAAMIAANARAKIGRVPEAQVASELLRDRVGVVSARGARSLWENRFWGDTKRHLSLVFLSLLATIAVAVPLGILAAKCPRLGAAILGVAGVVQTIPSLALLVFMIPLLGIGYWPAFVALFLYSLLPVLRNTVTGLQSIPAGLREAAEVLTLGRATRLLRIELPLASRSILCGIKTSAVLNVGMATLGALIGAGGYGEPILIGIRRDDAGDILQGAIPAALLALLMQWGFGVIEKKLVPRGLRYA